MDQWYINVGVGREEVLHVNKAVFLKSSKTKNYFSLKNKTKQNYSGDREMTQQLRTHTTLAETQVRFLKATSGNVKPPLTQVPPEDLMPSGLHAYLHMHSTHKLI